MHNLSINFVFRHSSTVLLLVAAVFFNFMSTAAHADSVERILAHSDKRPLNYVVYQDRLFFIENRKLMRLDSTASQPVELPLPSELSSRKFYPVNFVVFDGHLILSLGQKIFRLKNYDGEVTEIDTRLPRPRDPNQPDVAQRILGGKAFTVHNDRLYFVGHEPILGCGASGTTVSRLYSLSAADGAIEYVNSPTHPCGFRINLLSTEKGLVIHESLYPAARLARYQPNARLYVVSEPESYPLHGQARRPVPVPVATCGAANSRAVAYFDDDIYFTGRFHSIAGARDNTDSIGPLELGCEGPLYYHDPSQEEPFRYSPDTGTTDYFDIYRLTEEEKSLWESPGISGGSFGSSNPKDYVVANNALYFQAATHGHNKELFRKDSSCDVPQVLELNPNAPSEASPIGQYLGRLWLYADTGSGKALHYLDDDGMSAVPLAADILIEENNASLEAAGFVEFEGGVVFSAVSTSGEPGTYIARLDRTIPYSRADNICLDPVPEVPVPEVPVPEVPVPEVPVPEVPVPEVPVPEVPVPEVPVPEVPVPEVPVPEVPVPEVPVPEVPVPEVPVPEVPVPEVPVPEVPVPEVPVPEVPVPEVPVPEVPVPEVPVPEVPVPEVPVPEVPVPEVPVPEVPVPEVPVPEVPVPEVPVPEVPEVPEQPEQPEQRPTLSADLSANNSSKKNHRFRQGSPVTLKCRGTVQSDSKVKLRTSIIEKRGNRSSRALRSCNRNLRAGVNHNLCQVRVRAKSGKSSYSCRVTTRGLAGRQVVTRDSINIRGLRR